MFGEYGKSNVNTGSLENSLKMMKYTESEGKRRFGSDTTYRSGSVVSHGGSTNFE